MNFVKYLKFLMRMELLDYFHGVLSDDLNSFPHFQIIWKDLTNKLKNICDQTSFR